MELLGFFLQASQQHPDPSYYLVTSYHIALVAEIFLGYIFLLYFAVNIRHISNIGIFKLMRDHPSLLSGQLHFTTPFLYRISRISNLIFAIVWIILFFLFGRVFFLGGFIGMFHLNRTMTKWSNKASYNVIKYCGNCGKNLIDITSQFCGFCGTPIHRPRESTESEASSSPQAFKDFFSSSRTIDTRDDLDD
ncbi:MAG: zinc ribbon domain-containing protein [Candidatus Hodarchaeales archaeon]